MEMRHKHESFCIKEEATLYRIGVFAAMNHVSVRTLRFYEEQGLLQPVYTSPESGYRYYELSQMAVIHQITALKNAGFTLEEIARINSGEDEESIRESYIDGVWNRDDERDWLTEIQIPVTKK